MKRHLLYWLLVATAMVELMLPLRYGEAHTITKTLTQMPVTGQLAAGGAFHGWLTVHALRVDASGQLSATGILTGTATTTPGTATPIPPRPFTALAALLDLRGTCTTVVVDLAPIFLEHLAQEVTLVPIILTRRVIPKEERLLYTTLCVLARSQE